MAINYRTEPEFIEWLGGEAHPKVSPRKSHGKVQATFVLLLARCGALEYGTVSVETDALLMQGEKRTRFIPDVSFFTHEQDASDTCAVPHYSPAIAIEVWSPGDDASYLAQKIASYLQTGSELVLDVRIEDRQIRAHTNEGTMVFTEHDRFRNERFPWFGFPVRDAFSGIIPKSD